MNRPVCKKCLLAEIDTDGIYTKISDMIAALPEENRCGDAEYQRRLKICQSCENLGEGTCGVCGCFVELRAAKKNMRCPHETHYW